MFLLGAKHDANRADATRRCADTHKKVAIGICCD